MTSLLRTLLGIVTSVCAGVFMLGATVFGAGAAYFAYSIAAGPEATAAAEARDSTRMSRAIASAQEVRQALAVRITVPPLPPITEDVARGRLVKHPLTAVAHNRPPQAIALTPAALDAMAMDLDSVALAEPTPRYSYATFDRHRTY